MASYTLLFGALVLSIFVSCNAQNISKVFSRSSFPQGFVFGAGSSAFQFEGAVKEDGRKPTIWDEFSHTPGKIGDGSNADIALDHYHRYKEDIGILAGLRADAFRFSIAWSRIIPDGAGPVNQMGIDHYNEVINEALLKGLTPYVTIFHWDLPLALHKKYGGPLNPQFVKDYAVYAETLFQAFGDRVKHWTTFNEPHIFTVLGYNSGLFAPGRCSAEVGNCTAGNSAVEPYVVAHNILRAHAAATAIYNKKYKASQYGEIGITLDSQYYEPFSNSKRDKEAAERALLFNLGWFLHPIIYGDYPQVIKTNVGNRLPRFTQDESYWLKRSIDFVGINHYTTVYAADSQTRLGSSSNLLQSPNALFHPAYFKDTHVALTDRRGGRLIGQNINGFYVVPTGLRKLSNFVRVNYRNPKVYITENGISDSTSNSAPIQQQLNDVSRINYLQSYLLSLSSAISDGCNVKAYFTWALLDNWEWNSGFALRFGLIHIDYSNNLKRLPKKSATWFKSFLSM